MTDRDKTISPAGSPAGSPLRRRTSEDMTVRGFTASHPARIPRGGREFHGLSGPLRRTRRMRRICGAISCT